MSSHEAKAATTLLSGPIASNGNLSGSDTEEIEAVVGSGNGNGNGNGVMNDNGTAATIDSSSSSVATASSSSAAAKPGFSRMPSSKGSRFGGGLAGIVEASVASSMEQNLGNWTAPYSVTAKDLGELSQEPSRVALADLLYKGVINLTEAEVLDEETPSPTKKLQQDVLKLTKEIRAAEEGGRLDSDPKAALEAEKNADIAANVLTSVLLRSSPESGIDPREVEHRKQVFGTNALTAKKLDSFLKLCYEAVQDFVLMMLIVLGVISVIIEVTSKKGNGEKCTTCWIEGAAILVSVIIVVMITAGIDYAKQFAFLRLTKSLHDTNTKQVIRDGQQTTVIDDDIVVGDILSVNAHNLASIPADCVLLGPAGGSELHMDESALTGESKAIKKRPGDVVLSGTHAIQGSAKLVVIAVGVNSVAGRIRARVYETSDHESDLDDEGENSPLFVKLDIIAKRIGIGGTVAASVSFLASLIIGLGIQKDPASDIVTYLVTAITVLAVAVPEGLPLAVTLALAFSSNKMTKEQNLVKHLDACETMGCATTICTDKTGTLDRSFLRRVVLLCEGSARPWSRRLTLERVVFVASSLRRYPHRQQDVVPRPLRRRGQLPRRRPVRDARKLRQAKGGPRRAH
jgi:E1-E2 ATPase/Cation transporter/ATPase, N-terminus